MSDPKGSAKSTRESHGKKQTSTRQKSNATRAKEVKPSLDRQSSRCATPDQKKHDQTGGKIKKVALDKPSYRQPSSDQQPSNGARSKTVKTITSKEDKYVAHLSAELTPKATHKHTVGNSSKYTHHKESKASETAHTACASLPVPMAASGIKIVTMNVDGKSDGQGNYAERRKHTIENVITNEHPKLVIFQEFKMEHIYKWKEHPVPEYYKYLGNEEASLLVDTREISVFDDVRDTDLRRIIEQLQRTPNNQLHVSFPLEFNPLPRMYMVKVKTKGVPLLEFICVSYHGRWNKGFNKESIRQQEFKYFMEFLRVVHAHYRLPLLVGGDFNINIEAIESLVKHPFILSKYRASARRISNGVKDYFIYTFDLTLNNTRFIPLTKETRALNPEAVLDHDPVLTYLSN